jgi:hypothetical protein
MSKAGEKLIEAAKEAVSIAKGEDHPGQVSVDPEFMREVAAALRSAAAREAALVEAGRRALNYLENTESELGMTIDSADALRAALAAAKGDAP